jgi:hypothetical protein
VLSALIPGLSTVALQAWLLAALFRRRLFMRFPWFSSYTVYSVLAGGLRARLIFGDRTTYAYAYWLMEAPYALLGIAALWESFHQIVRHYRASRWIRMALPLTALALVAMAAVHVLLEPPVAHTKIWGAILAVSITIGNLQTGMCLLLLMFSLLLPISLDKHAVSVTYGFGIAACGTLVSSLIWAKHEQELIFVRTFAPVITYIIAVLVWLKSFSRSEQPVNAKYGTPTAELLDDLRRDFGGRPSK